MAEWFTVVDGVRLSWDQVVFKLSTGAWTLAEAVKHTALSPRALSMRLSLTEAAGGVVGRAAASALVRVGLVKAAGAGVAAGAGAGAAAGAGGIGMLGWLGIIGIIAAVGIGGYYVWNSSARGNPAPVSQPEGGDEGGDDGGLGDGEVCSEAQHQTACPWTPAGYTVGTCGPGKCWDGGPQGTLACKQVVTPANAGRSYTNDIVCAEGLVPRFGCNGVVESCDPR